MRSVLFLARVVAMPLLSMVVAGLLAGCKDSYSHPIVEPEKSEHEGLQLAGRWRLVEEMGEPATESVAIEFSTQAAGLLVFRFADQAHGAVNRCAVKRDGSDLLISFEVTSAGVSRWDLIRVRFTDGGNRAEVYFPAHDAVKAALAAGQLHGRTHTFVSGDDSFLVDDSPSELRDFFIANPEAFAVPRGPAVVFERVQL